MNTHKRATLDHPVNDLISRRWSPYAYTDKPVSDEDLRALFEAARWAPSSYNEQPWRYILATKADPREFERLLSCLVDGNRAWAKNAWALAIGCTTTKFTLNGKPNAAAQHDLGLASATLSIEATARGIDVHQMIGILPDRVRELYKVPEDTLPLTGLAFGYADNPSAKDGELHERDRKPRSRKKVSEFVFSGTWGQTSDLVK